MKWQPRIGELMLNHNLQDLIYFGWRKSGMIKLNYKVPQASIRDSIICLVKKQVIYYYLREKILVQKVMPHVTVVLLFSGSERIPVEFIIVDTC